MINVSKHIFNSNDIPAHWIFSYYLGLGKLKGQSVKIRSIFNEKERTPSLIIYYNRRYNRYTFKDFSSGISGSAIDFMRHKWKCSFAEAFNRIKKDYQNNDVKNEINQEDIKTQNWQVTSFVTGKWNKATLKFWEEYHITEEMLNFYNIKPLKSYVMSFVMDGEIVEEFTVNNKNIYGYFYGKEEGNLAKIYQPYNRDKKFIKVSNYIQGSDQTTGEQFLFIISSLKDLMALKTLGVVGDMLCVDSESSLFPQATVSRLKRTYKTKNIVVIFDNDIVGIKNMQKYKDEYALRFCYLPYEKDIADILKTHGIDESRRKIIPLINKTLNHEQIKSMDL